MVPEYKIQISPRALRHLQMIFDYIEGEAPGAGKTVDSMIDEMVALRTMPHRFPVVGGGHGLRRMVAYPYLIFYKILPTQRVVRIMSIRHGARRGRP